MNKKEKLEECICQMETVGYVLREEVKVPNPNVIYDLLRDLRVALQLQLKKL